MAQEDIRAVQLKILEIMVHIDKICKEHDITYFIMAGTALGAVRHGGFIPWDDDMDIFMTPDNYEKFKTVFLREQNEKFILQEWKTTPDYLEYAKIRMNGTTFIESVFQERKDLHQGIYLDIMILHKCPNSLLMQKILYFQSKYVTLYALSKRNWKPKNSMQKFVLGSLKLLPNKFLVKMCYHSLYRFDYLKESYKYHFWFTSGNFRSGLFDWEMFNKPENIMFEGHSFYAPQNIHKYLEICYGDYMKLPSAEEQNASMHAMIWDTQVSYEHYMNQ